jgi:hypothetical protein
MLVPHLALKVKALWPESERNLKFAEGAALKSAIF